MVNVLELYVVIDKESLHDGIGEVAVAVAGVVEVALAVAGVVEKRSGVRITVISLNNVLELGIT